MCRGAQIGLLVLMLVALLPTDFVYAKMGPDHADRLFLEMVDRARRECKCLSTSLLEYIDSFDKSPSATGTAQVKAEAKSGGFACLIHQRSSEDLGGLFLFLPLIFWCLWRRRKLT